MLAGGEPCDRVAPPAVCACGELPAVGDPLVCSAKFIGWTMGSGETLICPGIPGAGKTMAAAIAIDQLRKKANAGLAWVFCNHKRQATQTASALISSILKQILQQRLIAEGVEVNASQISFRSAVVSRFFHPMSPSLRVLRILEECKKSGTRLMRDQLIQALVLLCTGSRSTCIVIDALDECSDQYAERTRLIKGLRHLQRAELNLRVNLMFTTRFVEQIIDSIGPATSFEIRAPKTDIKLYVEGRLEGFSTTVRSDHQLKQSISERIVESADGMYAWICRISIKCAFADYIGSFWHGFISTKCKV